MYRLLYLIHLDIYGPIKVPSVDGAWNLGISTDAYSSLVIISPIRRMSQAKYSYIYYGKLVNREVGHLIQAA